MAARPAVYLHDLSAAASTAAASAAVLAVDENEGTMLPDAAPKATAAAACCWWWWWAAAADTYGYILAAGEVDDALLLECWGEEPLGEDELQVARPASREAVAAGLWNSCWWWNCWWYFGSMLSIMNLELIASRLGPGHCTAHFSYSDGCTAHALRPRT